MKFLFISVVIFLFVRFYSDDYSSNLNKLIFTNIQGKRIILFPDSNHGDQYNDYLFYNFVKEYRERYPGQKVGICLELPSNYNVVYALKLYRNNEMENLYRYFSENDDYSQGIYEFSRISEIYDKDQVTFHGLEESSSVEPEQYATGSFENRTRILYKRVKDREILIANNLNQLVKKNPDTVYLVFYGNGHLTTSPNLLLSTIGDEKIRETIKNIKKWEAFPFNYYVYERNILLIINRKVLLTPEELSDISNKNIYQPIEYYGNQNHNQRFADFIVSENIRSDAVFRILLNSPYKSSYVNKRMISIFKQLGCKEGKTDLKKAFLTLLKKNWSHYTKEGYIVTDKIYPFVNIYSRITPETRRLINRINTPEKVVDITIKDAQLKNQIITAYFGYENEKKQAHLELLKNTGKKFKYFHEWIDWYYLSE